MRKRQTGRSRHVGKQKSRLEQKLDGLVELLKSDNRTQLPEVFQSNPSNLSPDSGLSVQDDLSGSNTYQSVTNPQYAYEVPLVSHSEDTESSYAQLITPNSEPASVILQNSQHPFFRPTPEEAELNLHRFRTQFVPHFPFVIIPESMTADQLHHERPILWLSIMTVASVNTTQQIALSKHMREIFGKEVYVEGTRNMDLLLGILVYTAW